MVPARERSLLAHKATPALPLIPTPRVDVSPTMPTRPPSVTTATTTPTTTDVMAAVDAPVTPSYAIHPTPVLRVRPTALSVPTRRCQATLVMTESRAQRTMCATPRAAASALPMAVAQEFVSRALFVMAQTVRLKNHRLEPHAMTAIRPPTMTNVILL